MKKRIGSILMAVCMIMTLLPLTAMAASTDSCLEDSCSHEAAINTTHYDTLTEALSAATEGQTVMLLKNIDNSVDAEDYGGKVSYTLKASTTLDGDGHTISGHIGVYIPAEGATVQNVKFMNIHNKVVVDEATCEKYGWTSKTGNQSAIYASNLTGTATITGCTFDNIDWDAIQITPAASTAEIVIKDNKFTHTNTTDTQLRYVHVEHTLPIFSGNQISELTITDNQFYDTKNPDSSICSIGVWYVNRNTTTLKVDGNYIETPSTAEVDKLTVKALYPMRSQASVDKDDIAPVAYYGSDVYSTLQEAIDKTKTYVYLMADTAEETVIPAGRIIKFYSYGYDIGTLTNNGELTVYGSDLPESSKIINNGTLTLSGNAATVYEIENNGVLNITSGKTYYLSKITGDGAVSITGGTFSTKPDETMIPQWYIAKEQSDGTYKVSKMTLADAVTAGAVASSSKSGGTYYTSITDAVNSSSAYLQTDSDEDVVFNAGGSSGRGLRFNNHEFTGSITIAEGCDYVVLYGDKATLKKATGADLRIGTYNTAADVTIQDADLEKLNVAASGDCTVNDGEYGSVTVNIYYANKTAAEPKYTGQLTISGGCFASNTVTVSYTNHTLEDGSNTEKVPLSNYVAEGYTVIITDGKYPYQVVQETENAAAVVGGAPEVKTNLTGSDNNVELAESAATALGGGENGEGATAEVEDSALAAAAAEIANANTDKAETYVEDLKTATGDKTVSPEEITIAVQHYVDIKVTGATSTEQDDTTIKTLTLDITPMMQKVATTANLTGKEPDEIVLESEDESTKVNAVPIGDPVELKISIPVEITLPLPEDFVTGDDPKVFVQHNGHEYNTELSKDKKTITFTNPHGFSLFTITTQSQTVATIGNDARYTSLQTAVNEAGSDDTITLLKDGLEASTNKTIKVQNTGNSSITVKINGTDYTIQVNETKMITYTAPSHDSDGGSTVTRYSVTVEEVRNGEVSVSPSRAAYNQTVTITVTPDKGYELSGLTVTDRDGDELDLTAKGNGQYTFKMPRSAVTVEAVFARVESELTFTDVPMTEWYYNAVVYAVDNGIMGGFNAQTFGPEETLPRSQMVQVLYNLSGQPDLTGLNLGYPFADVEGGQWYANAVYWARLSGIAGGYNDNTFRPDRPVTRQEAAVMMRSYALLMGCDVSYDGQPVLAFADSGEVDSWAWDAMSWAVDAGVMGGKGGVLDPTGIATRAEIAQMMMSLCENVLNG